MREEKWGTRYEGAEMREQKWETRNEGAEMREEKWGSRHVGAEMREQKWGSKHEGADMRELTCGGKHEGAEMREQTNLNCLSCSRSCWGRLRRIRGRWSQRWERRRRGGGRCWRGARWPWRWSSWPLGGLAEGGEVVHLFYGLSHQSQEGLRKRIQ